MRRTDFCLTWLWQMTICITMALSQLLLSILRTEYETPAVGEWVTIRQADVDGWMEADHTTSEGARSAAIVYWKDGSGDRGLFRGSSGSGRCCGRTGRAAGIGTVQSTPRGLNSAKGRSFGLSYAGTAASSMAWVWWIGFRAGLD
jgi:hypothetical protein